MKIKQLKLNNFMLFHDLQLKCSPNINIISGENSTGKTALLKIMYTCVKGNADAANSKGELTKEKLEDIYVSKMQGVFRPEKDMIGRLVSRRRGNTETEVKLKFSSDKCTSFSFGNRQAKHLEIAEENVADFRNVCPVYIPPKEIISATENFVSLYADYHIAFEETYYDLARLLERPLRKGPNSVEQNRVMSSFESIVNGNIIQRDRNFYLKVAGKGEFEMGLLSEGYRKLSTIMYLILSGSLSQNSILFWDEPETNMNPRMIKPMVDAIIELARMGVQVFVTTHDYFVQQCFSLCSEYQRDKDGLRFEFISLYPRENEIEYETASRVCDLKNNAIMDEFDQLYDREQRLIYGN